MLNLNENVSVELQNLLNLNNFWSDIKWKDTHSSFSPICWQLQNRMEKNYEIMMI